MMPCTTHNFMVDLFVWILHRQKSNWLCFSPCFSQIWHYFCLHGNFMVTSLCRPPSGNKALMKLNDNWKNIETSWWFVFPIFEINKAVVLKSSGFLGVFYGGPRIHGRSRNLPPLSVTLFVRLPRHFPPLWPAACIDRCLTAACTSTVFRTVRNIIVSVCSETITLAPMIGFNTSWNIHL